MALQHVLIIGGGLAGPCLALSLARYNIRSTIFEIRPERSDSGGSISLGPNALQVLDKYAGVYEQVKAAGFTYHSFGAYTEDGEKLGEIEVGKEDGYPAVRVMRSTLHQVLLKAAEATDGLIAIKYGARLKDIEQGDQGVTLTFEDGSSAAGDVLIGADGVHSKVREYVLKSTEPLAKYCGVAIINGFVPASAVNKPEGYSLPAFNFSRRGFLMTIPIDPKGETIAWGINKVLPERSREEWRELEQSGDAARLAKSDYSEITAEPIRSLLDKADDAEARLYVPYEIPDIPKWHLGRVCLIGDAAHAMRPNGNGSGVAFEDAAIMTRILTDDTPDRYEQKFERYERARRPRVDAVRKSTGTASVATRTETGPWMWFVKTLAFRAFFWWKGGALWHSTSYDVDAVDIR